MGWKIKGTPRCSARDRRIPPVHVAGPGTRVQIHGQPNITPPILLDRPNGMRRRLMAPKTFTKYPFSENSPYMELYLEDITVIYAVWYLICFAKGTPATSRGWRAGGMLE